MGELKLLSSGYWYLRFSANRFAQWPRGRDCQPEDIFCGCGENADLAAQANTALAAMKEDANG